MQFRTKRGVPRFAVAGELVGRVLRSGSGEGKAVCEGYPVAVKGESRRFDTLESLYT